MARNFKKIAKTDPLRSPIIHNTDRGSMVMDENAGKPREKKVLFQIKYTTPVPFASEFPINNEINTVTECPIGAILQCNVRIDEGKLLKGIILCPYRKNVLKTLLFKFGVEKFYSAKVDVLRFVGEAHKN